MLMGRHDDTAKRDQKDAASVAEGETKNDLTSTTTETTSDRKDTTASKESTDTTGNRDPGTIVYDSHGESKSAGNAKAEGKDERIALLRKRNALYSKRKYYKKKKEVSSLESMKFDLEAKNQALRQENLRLESLLGQVRQKVASLGNYPTADFVNGPKQGHLPAFSGLPSLYPYETLPYGYGALGSSSGIGGNLPIAGAGPFSSTLHNPYAIREAYLRNSILQQERERFLNLQITSAMAQTHEMPHTRLQDPSVAGLSLPPGDEREQLRTSSNPHMALSMVPPRDDLLEYEKAGVGSETEDSSEQATTTESKDEEVAHGKSDNM